MSLVFLGCVGMRCAAELHCVAGRLTATLPEFPAVPYPANQHACFNGERKFITVLTTVRNLSLS
jgi:hypothetical protein